MALPMQKLGSPNLNFAVNPYNQESQPRTKNDAQMGIQELEVLRDVDLVAPADATDAAELVRIYQDGSNSGDHLRLDQKTFFDGPSMRAAVHRVLSADTRNLPSADQEAMLKEGRMLRVLEALDATIGMIQQRAKKPTY